MRLRKISFLADVHAGNHRRFAGVYKHGINERCRLIVDTLRSACATAASSDALVIAGDLFDTVRPSPQIITEVADALKLGPAKTYILVGNHDQQSEHPGDHALGPLGLLPGVEVVDRPKVIKLGWDIETPDGLYDASLVMVPYQRGPAEEWLTATVRGLKPGRGSILVTHVGVSDNDTPEFLQGANDSVGVGTLRRLMKKRGISWTVVGNWHKAQRWQSWRKEEDIIQCGALVPTGFNNLGIGDEYGRLWTLQNSNRWASVQIAGPRFVTVTSEDELTEALNHAPNGTKLYVQWKCLPENINEVRSVADYWMNDDEARQSMSDDGLHINGISVMADVPKTKERRAAVLVPSVETTLRQYVAKHHPKRVEAVTEASLRMLQGD